MNFNFDRTIAQGSIKSLLNSSLKQNKLPQSSIFYGQQGMGQYALACDLIENIVTSWENHLICFPSSEKDSIPSENEQFEQYRSLLENPYQDLHQKRNIISINQIRNLSQKILYKSVDQRKRIVSIWGIEYLTLSATNALLKVLEDTPPHTYFILISNQINQILPTIRSRCVEFFFPNLSQKDFFPLKEFEEPIKQKLLMYSGYSPTKLYNIQSLGGEKLIEQCFHLFKLLINQNWIHFNQILEKEEIWNDTEKTNIILSICLEILSLTLKNKLEPLPDFYNTSFIKTNSTLIRYFLENSLLRIKENSKPLIALSGLFLHFKNHL